MRSGRSWTAALLVGLLSAAIGCRSTEKQKQPPPATQPATAEAVRPSPPPGKAEVWQTWKVYLCHRARGRITIDEKNHPEEWAHATVIKDFKVPVSLTPVRSQTEARLLWDDECLYANFFARDLDLRGRYTQRTDPLWNEDVVELFLKPYADKPCYYELEVNPINTVMALAIPDTKKRPPIKEMSQWETGIRSAVQVMGTLNEPKDRDSFYRVLLAIPWKNLAFIGGKPPKAGEQWKFTVCRYDYSDYLAPSPEEQTSAPLTDQSFHHHQDYSVLEFAE